MNLQKILVEKREQLQVQIDKHLETEKKLAELTQEYEKIQEEINGKIGNH